MQNNLTSIRKFIVKHFDDTELRIFAADYFRDVYDDFADEMRKSRKAELLVDYCFRHGRIDDLMAALERERKRPFHHTFPNFALPKKTKQLFISRNPNQIFISHAHQDETIALQLAKTLEENGWKTWFTRRDIQAGESWGEAIDRGLEECGIMIVLLSYHSVQSNWVKTETYIAIDLEHKNEIRLFFVELEECKIPLLWNKYQRISIRINKDLNLKTLVKLLLPLTAKDSQETEQLVIDQNEPRKNNVAEPQFTILVVDAEREFQNLYEVMFSRIPARVLKATYVSEGMKLLTPQVDLIISSIMIPNISGLEFCQFVKKDPSTAKIPFIFVTTVAAREAKQEALNLGAEMFIEKPFEVEWLIATVSQLLKSKFQKQELW